MRSAADEPFPDPGGSTEQLDRLRIENEQLRLEIRTLRERPPGPRRSIGHRLRVMATPLLVILTSLALVGATVSVWINRTIWNTDRYVALVAPLAEDPAVTQALSTKLTDSAVQALNLEERVRNALALIPRLPDAAGFLAGPITAGAQDLIQRQVETFLASQTFKDLWVELNRTLHTKIVALLEGDYSQLPSVSVEGGEVRLNLISVLARLLQRIVQRGIDGLGLDVTVPSIPTDLDASAGIARLSDALGVSLPANFGQVAIMTQAQLTSYQEAARTFKLLRLALVLIVIALIALTLTVSVNRRRTTMWVGISAVAGLFLGGVFIRRIEGRIVDSIARPGAQAAARDVFAEVSASLRDAGLVVGGVALAVVIGAYLAGRPRWLLSAAGAVRRATAGSGARATQVWVARHADIIRIAIVVVAVLTLFVTGIDWLPVVLVASILALAMWWISLAQRTVAESPQ